MGKRARKSSRILVCTVVLGNNTLNCRKTSKKKARCYSPEYSEYQFSHNFVLIFRNKKLYSFWCIKTKTNSDLPKFTFNSMSMKSTYGELIEFRQHFYLTGLGPGTESGAPNCVLSHAPNFLAPKYFLNVSHEFRGNVKVCYWSNNIISAVSKTKFWLSGLLATRPF